MQWPGAGRGNVECHHASPTPGCLSCLTCVRRSSGYLCLKCIFSTISIFLLCCWQKIEIFFVFTSNIFLCCKVEPTSPVVYCPVSGYCPTSRSPNLRTILIPTFNTGQWPPAESGAGPRTTVSHVTQLNLSLRWKPKFNLIFEMGKP